MTLEIITGDSFETGSGAFTLGAYASWSFSGHGLIEGSHLWRGSASVR